MCTNTACAISKSAASKFLKKVTYEESLVQCHCESTAMLAMQLSCTVTTRNSDSITNCNDVSSYAFSAIYFIYVVETHIT